jgi:cytochrome b
MQTKESVLVWDIWVRLFHWFNVTAFFAAYVTTHSLVFPGHVWSGYAVLALVVLRIFWGFAGSKSARFSDFIYSPRTVLINLWETLRLHPKTYLGHSPIGGYMIVLLLIGLLVISATGVVLIGIEGTGPLRTVTAGVEWEPMRAIHEQATSITLVLVFAHVLGVVFSAVTRNEDLVGAMFTGRKRV